MKTALAIASVGLAMATPFTAGTERLVALLAAGALLHRLATGSFRRTLVSALPISLFAGGLVALQWLGGGAGAELPLKTMTIFLLMTAAARLGPVSEMLGRFGPRSRLFGPVLFLLFIRHFVLILGQEARRVFMARRLAVPVRYGPGWFDSLTWALAGLFRRSMTRVERFYGGLLVRGFDE